VDGIGMRQMWADLEPAEGVYDWTYLDNVIARAAAAGKAVLLRIGTGGGDIALGGGCPTWVMDAVAAEPLPASQKFYTFNDDDNGRSVTIAVFWDPVWLAKKTAMITALGARYSNNPAVKIVGASFANATSEDWGVPHTPPEVTAWFAAGYTTQKMLDAGATIIDATMAAFPNQYVTLAVAANGPTLDPDSNYVARNAVLNARASWPGRLIVQKDSLATFIPAAPGTGTAWELLWNSRPDVAGQMLYWCYGDTTYRVNHGVPIDPSTALVNSVNNGVAYGMKYIEIYLPDVLNLLAATHYAHQQLFIPNPTPTPSQTPTPTTTPTPTVQVTVQTSPTGLTFSVDGTTYSSTQTFSWASGSSHTVATTSPQNGATGVRYAFTRWSDNGAISHTVAPTTNKTYTATFTTQYYLTMAHGTGGTVSPGSGWRNAGAVVSISATPTNNTQVSYSFAGWTGSGTGSYSGTNNPASITMNGPITENAAFTQNPVQVTVQTDPAGLSFAVDGTTYTAAQTFSWAPGSSHTIASTSPQSGDTGVRYVWSNWNWGGAISHTVAPTTNKTYTANFTTQYYLTMSHGVGGTVSPGSGWRNSGVTVSITATPSTGYSFSNWAGTGTGSYSGTTNPGSITMGGPITEAATFTH
jgi:hypothetical protein